MENIKLDITNIELLERKEGELPKFKFMAYSGKQINFGYGDYVFDLEGMQFKSKVPIFLSHDYSKPVGHASLRVENNQLLGEGVFSVDSEDTQRIINSSKNGFPWGQSIGIAYHYEDLYVLEQEEIINGNKVAEKTKIIKKSKVLESSWTAMPVDDRTVGKSKALEIEQLKEIKVMSEKEKIDNVDKIDKIETVDLTAEINKEKDRLVNLAKVCKGQDEIFDKAVAEGWTLEAAKLAVAEKELDVLRNERANFTPQNKEEVNMNQEVLEAALYMSHGGSEEDAVKCWGEKATEKARKQYKGNLGIQGLCRELYRLSGEPQPFAFGDDEVRRCLYHQFSVGGSSSYSVPGLTGSVAGRMLLNAYRQHDSVAKIISNPLEVANFNEVQIYSLDVESDLVEVPNDGEVQHGAFAETDYAAKLATYAKMIWITRQTIINDDLGLVLQAVNALGVGAARLEERMIMGLVDGGEGADFFSLDNQNLVVGADSALGLDSLATAEAYMMSQTDAMGNPIYVNAKYLVVPPALKAMAHRLYVSENIVSATTQPESNYVKGRFVPLASPYLTDNDAWYLFGDENRPAILRVYLRGNSQPSLKQAESPLDRLAYGWRVVHDFGVAYVDPKVALKAVGSNGNGNGE